MLNSLLLYTDSYSWYDLLNFLFLIFLTVAGFLQIFLFFKIWGMTNDVAEIRDLLSGNAPEGHGIGVSGTPCHAPEEPAEVPLAPACKPEVEIRVGDYVTELGGSRRMKVDAISNGVYFCYVSFMEGQKKYRRGQIKPAD